MRNLVVILSLAALLGCSTTAATPSAPEMTPVAALLASPTSNRGAQMLAQAGRANAPTRADIERTFGAGDISRQDGAGVALTYRLSTCALLLVFTADAHNTLRLMDAHASARQAGQAAPTLDQCGAEAEAHHP
ncbi:MAG: hypothetical protein HY054_04900 [Proteobacteria bacterium]|nr:hypothetical protein [Pseudomonadota bacterium]